MGDSNPEHENALSSQLRRPNDLRAIATAQASRVTARKLSREAKRRWAIVKEIDDIEMRLQSLPIEDPMALKAQIDAIAKKIEVTQKKDDAAADRAQRRAMGDWIRQERAQKARKATQALAETPAKSRKAARAKRSNMYPQRAAWFKDRLDERKWTLHKLEKKGGPEHRTSQRVLDGKEVQDRVLESITRGLSVDKRFPPVKPEDIRND